VTVTRAPQRQAARSRLFHAPQEKQIVNKGQIKGRAEELAGKAKKVTGKVVHDESLKQKGRIQEVAGKTRATYGDTKEEWKKDDSNDA
jgi:uncharacterized protein YjbJ (UPF0337 family)